MGSASSAEDRRKSSVVSLMSASGDGKGADSGSRNGRRKSSIVEGLKGMLGRGSA